MLPNASSIVAFLATGIVLEEGESLNVTFLLGEAQSFLAIYSLHIYLKISKKNSFKP